MWIPKTEKEIVDARANRTLEETVTFDGKRELPLKNIDMAKDISAFTNTAGGVLVYGLGEDNDRKLTVLNPIKLKGERERIDQIVRTCIDEVASGGNHSHFLAFGTAACKFRLHNLIRGSVSTEAIVPRRRSALIPLIKGSFPANESLGFG
jgi:hypothetical protein